VTRISPAVNTGTRAFPFEAAVPIRMGALKPGRSPRVHVESGKVDEVLTLPYSALQYRYGVNRVFVREWAIDWRCASCRSASARRPD
jgi:hypothetical protein